MWNYAPRFLNAQQLIQGFEFGVTTTDLRNLTRRFDESVDVIDSERFEATKNISLTLLLSLRRNFIYVDRRKNAEILLFYVYLRQLVFILHFLD